MASNLRVDSIVPTTSGNVSIGTATGGVTIPGNLGIAGVLTYEDVTNVDSVGVITARGGINVTSGNIALSSNGANVSPSGFDFKIRSNTAKLGIHIDNASGTPTLEFGTGNATGGAITTNSTTPLVFKPNNSERLRITSNGEIGIGGANYGTSGQVLTSQGSGSAVQWATPGLIYEGSVTSLPTNAGQVDVDVILSTAKRIEIFILSYSTSSNSGEFVLRLRTASGSITSGYKGSGHYLSNTSYASSSQNSDGFKSLGLGGASANYSGHIVLKNVNSKTWFCNGDFWNDASATGYWMSGHVDAGATVTGLVLRNDSSDFDAGTYKIIQYNTL